LQAALCTLIGSAGGYTYLALLCRDIDAVKGSDRSPMREADAIPETLQRRIAKGVVAYQMSLQPRLLVCSAALLPSSNPGPAVSTQL